MKVGQVTCALAALSFAAPATAQQIDFRYRPRAGTAVRTLTEERTVTTLFGFPMVPDGASFETKRRVNATQFVLAVLDGGRRVEVEIDSIRARRRAADGLWVTLTDTTAVGKPVRATLNERFAVTGIETAGQTDAEVLRMMGAGLIGFGFSFPSEPVAAGTTFPTGGRLHYQVRLTDEGGIPVRETLAGDLVLTLDSVVDAGSDRLAYLRFAGTFDPRIAASESESGSVTVTFSGGFAGRLIWSSGWNAFVSAAARVMVQGSIRVVTATGQTEASAGWDATIMHRVRP